MISVHFQGKPINITVIQVHGPSSNAEEVEVEQFYEYLQDLLELTPQKRHPFHYRGLDAKVGSQVIPGVTGRFGFGVQNDSGKRLTEFCKRMQVIAKPSRNTRLYTWTSPDGQH